MYFNQIRNIKKVEMNAPGVKNAAKQVLIGPEEGWNDYVMRMIILEGNGHSPKHSHPWPHINYVVKGEGILYMDGKEYSLETGSVAYVPDNIEHQYINSNSEEELQFICIVPTEGDK